MVIPQAGVFSSASRGCERRARRKADARRSERKQIARAGAAARVLRGDERRARRVAERAPRGAIAPPTHAVGTLRGDAPR